MEAPLSAELIAVITAAIVLGGVMLATTGSIRRDVGERFGTLAERIGNVEHQVGMLAERFGTLAERTATLAERIGNLEHQVATLTERVGNVEHQVATFGERVARLEGTLDVLRQYFAPPRDTDQGAA